MFEPTKNKLYRPCVGICLFNSDGLVFVAERNDAPGAWQMPQGGIDEGEDPYVAAMRELEEEIGTNKADFIARMDDWLYYDLPKDLRKKVWHGRYWGQKQIWYGLRFKGSDRDINLLTKQPEFARYKWVPLEDTISLIVPFKRGVYREVMNFFGNLGKS